MPFTLHGIGVSDGIAIGRAHLITQVSLDVSHYLVEAGQIAQEEQRLRSAIAQVQDELSTLHAELDRSGSGDLGAFVDVHVMLLSDPMLAEEPLRIVRERRCNAEWALIQQMDALMAQFDEIEDEYLRERRHDVGQVVERVLKALIGAQPAMQSALTKTQKIRAQQSQESEMIVVAHDLSPADMLVFKEHQFAGFVTDVGGATSHTAIMARSLALPAVVALHHAREMIREDDLIIIDGRAGVLIVAPDAAIIAEYRRKRERLDGEREALRLIVGTRTATRDGTGIDLEANIELPGDVPAAHDAGAAGVGLFRTEFLFMNRKSLPDEEEQFQAYAAVVRAMQGHPVTIRTLDIGADKQLDAELAHDGVALNPALGLRAIRYCLSEPQMFSAQLRAILRASALGPVRILLPMIAHAYEVTQTLALIREAKLQLGEAGEAFDPEVKVGGMIEIPAAALALPMFLDKLDYLSIGTNDLIQYTLAIDRADDAVSGLYDPLHPAVLYLIAHTIRTADAAGVPVAVCGEMAGELAMTRLLLGMGLRQFSMHPAQILSIKQRVLATDLAQVRPLVARMLATTEPTELRALLDELNA
ncbi:MAG: phosphoenolpyruvate--protein phosphotransferase [Burkholderiales bacterium]